jgi:hypothetical protein
MSVDKFPHFYGIARPYHQLLSLIAILKIGKL